MRAELHITNTKGETDTLPVEGDLALSVAAGSRYEILNPAGERAFVSLRKEDGDLQIRLEDETWVKLVGFYAEESADASLQARLHPSATESVPGEFRQENLPDHFSVSSSGFALSEKGQSSAEPLHSELADSAVENIVTGGTVAIESVVEVFTKPKAVSGAIRAGSAFLELLSSSSDALLQVGDDLLRRPSPRPISQLKEVEGSEPQVGSKDDWTSASKNPDSTLFDDDLSSGTDSWS